MMTLGELEVGESLGGTPGVWPKGDPDNPVCRMSGDLDRETAKRYARLFAAAPDLLAACKLAFDTFFGETMVAGSSEAINALDAAINKAEAQS